jgi:hypothetical protein
MHPVAKAATLLLTAAVALAGFFILETTRAVLWLIFLAAAYPVIISFVVSLSDGTRFTPKDLIAIYRESIRALPLLLKFIRDLFRQDRQ